MPIFGFTQTCVPSIATPDGLCITMPGGVEICASIPSPVPIPQTQLVAALIGQLNTALAPLQPVFNIIDAVIAVFDCIKAVATLNPSKIAACIPDLAQAVDALIKLIPQLSLPLMIRDFVLAMIAFLQGFIEDLTAMIEYQLRIRLATNRAAKYNVDIAVIIDCAQKNLEIELAHKGKQVAPIEQLINLINAFLKLLGLPCIPSFSTPNLSEGFLAYMRELSDFLSFLASVITIPIPKLPKASNEC
jgi:hypothetical protein